MTRLVKFVVACAAVVAFAAVAVSTASATELPEFTVQTNATGTSGAGKLNLTGAAIKSGASKFTLTASSKQAGKVSIDFEKALLGGEECHSLGDDTKPETILVDNANFTLVAGTDLVKIEPTAAVHIECKFGATLVLIPIGANLGILGQLKTKGVKGKTFTLVVKVNAGVQEFTKWTNDSGVETVEKFEGSINGGANKAATLEQAEVNITTASETELIK